MNQVSLKALEILEFPKVLQRVARFASFSASKELAASLLPSLDRDEVVKGQTRTTEARHLLAIKPSFSIGEAHDVRAEVRQASIGSTMLPESLLRVGNTLASARIVRGTLFKLADQVPELADVANRIVECTPLENDISRCIDERGEIPDRASPLLAKIREQTRVAHDRLLSKLNEILGSPAGRLGAQESIVTMREGRYVIPVKSDFRGQIRGLVHDTSASGATLFIEPMAVVELNNKWRQGQIEEEKEIERIIRHLSGYVGALATEISGNVAALAEIDLNLAKAKYAESIRAVEPQILAERRGNPDAERRRLMFRNARHPLLAGNVVPISVELGGQFSILVITGPNTGGKTVTLKTVGLLTLMAQAGLALPADEGSYLSTFEGVAADIGDEQSIEQSLSTFSSHVRNIVSILEQATSRTLVLLDELGAGTDPSEGAALARAILTQLLQRGILTVATTHSNELKAFAHMIQGVQNASVEFDVETLAPTYRLLIGLPGRSNALAIASKLGLPPEILAAATQMISPTEIQVEQLLAKIQAERAEAEGRWQLLAERTREIDEMKRQLHVRLEEIEDEKEVAVEKAQQQFFDEVADLRTRIRQMNAGLAAQTADRTALVNAVSEVEAVRQETVRRVSRPRVRRRVSVPSERSALPLRTGTTVYVRHLKQIGELLSEPDSKDEVEVQLGAFKVRVRADAVETRKRPSVKPEAEISRINYSLSHQAVNTPAISIDLDLRGKRADEVFPTVDQYLNDAYLAGLPFVRLIHGKGTGALRQVVRQQLSGHPLVSTFVTAPPHEGGEGVTVATLAH